MVTATSDFIEVSDQVLELTAYEANRLGASSQRSEHLLYGLLSSEDMPAYRLIQEVADIRKIRSRLDAVYRAIMPVPEKTPATGEPTPALHGIMRDARIMYQRDLEPHLDPSIFYLLAILRRDGVASDVLVNEGITFERVREFAEKYRGN